MGDESWAHHTRFLC